MTTFIYSLLCPITGAPRYVGKSDCPESRTLAHIRRAKNGEENNTRKSRWILSLVRLGLEPVLQVLLEAPQESWTESEKEYIRRFKEIGWDLVNGTEGGEGGALTGEALLKMAESRRGKKQSFETVEKRVSKIRGKKQTPEAKQKHSEYKRSYWAGVSVEERSLRCAAMREFKTLKK